MSKLKKALQKAKETRQGYFSTNSISEKQNVHPILESYGVKPSRRNGQKKIDIKYSKTRVERVDRGLLKRNKILSLFKQNQTTDQVDILRTQVLAKLGEIGGNSILVTSAHSGEGKSFTSINLGVSIAQQLERTVLIVDTDLRNPWKHHADFASDFWGLHTEVGLADYLMEKVEIEDVLINPGIDKLTILPAGRPMSNSAELLGSKRMEQFIEDVKNRYGSDRICIFDSPALLRCTDPLVFAHLFDGILLVVEAEKTTAKDIQKVIRLLEGKPVIGTVFNKSKDKHQNDYV